MKTVTPEGAADEYQRYADGSIRCPVHIHAVLPVDGEHAVFMVRAFLRPDQVSSLPAGAVSEAFRAALAEAGIEAIGTDARFVPDEHTYDYEDEVIPQP